MSGTTQQYVSVRSFGDVDEPGIRYEACRNQAGHWFVYRVNQPAGQLKGIAQILCPSDPKAKQILSRIGVA